MIPRISFWPLLALILTLGTAVPAAAEETNSSRNRTWKTVEDLSPQERHKLDLETDTPRHPQVPYLPAEPYPFTPPYTAEEMGYRLMEFTSRPRWSAVFARAWASISTQGVLLNPGSATNFLAYNSNATGVEAELALKPGEEIYRSLSQRTTPAASEGSQRLSIRYRTGKEFIKKEERFQYSQSRRRVRHDAPRRRQSKIPNMALTPDDNYGRDAWEFSWRVLGLDTLSQTVRFPNTRLTIMLRNSQTGQFQERRTAELKLMGDSYRYYTATDGVACYVVEAQAQVPSPALFFLRPALEEEKFPAERPLRIPSEVAARVRAQEAAGRLVFEMSGERR